MKLKKPFKNRVNSKSYFKYDKHRKLPLQNTEQFVGSIFIEMYRKSFIKFIILSSLLFVLLLSADLRILELEYEGEGKILKPLPFYTEEPYFFTQIPGKDFKEILCDRITWFKNHDCYRQYQEKTGILDRRYALPCNECEIVLNENLQIDDKAHYFVGVGCRIKKIIYFYHSKFFNCNETDDFLQISDSIEFLEPLEEPNAIMIYRNTTNVFLVP
jgi:hypothetical protein